MSSSAIAIRDDQTEFDENQVSVLRTLGLQKADRGDLALFFHVCARTGLDPFARQIYMIERWTKDGPKQSIQTGIDGFRLIAQRTAERTGEAFGYEDTQWCGEDGQWRDVWLSKEPPSAARVSVLRDGQRFPAVALMREYAQTTKQGALTKMWAEKGALMLAKCAEAAALRKAFPLDLSGLYTPDEMQHEDRPAATPRPRGMDAIKQAVAEPTNVTEYKVVNHEAEPPSEPSTPKLHPKQRAKMFALFTQKGIAEGDQKPGIEHIIGRHIEHRDEITTEEYETVLAVLEAKADAQGEAVES